MINKFYKASRGLLLMMSHLKTFDPHFFDGKRVAIVGPAASANHTGRGAMIDDFDVVVRVNKSAKVVREGKFRDDIGTKLDVLFHSFFENEFSGGGPLDFKMFDELGVRYVVNPIPGYFGKRVIFNFYKKYLLARPVYTVDAAPYEQAVKAFGQFRPTTGFCALRMLMEAEFSELFITGFTFFKTPYGDGYRDSLKDVSTNKKYISDSNIHNPDIEYEEFKKLLASHSRKTIFVDKDLRLILAGDGVTATEIPS